MDLNYKILKIKKRISSDYQTTMNQAKYGATHL